MTKKYPCPLCHQESAYQSFGYPTSIVCKCQGLTEVGILENGIYLPNQCKQITKQKIRDLMSDPNGSYWIQDFNYSFHGLRTDIIIEKIGSLFMKSLGDPIIRKHYTSLGQIWIGEYDPDHNYDVLFFIRNDNKYLENVIHKMNRQADQSLVDKIKELFRNQNVVAN